MKVTFENLAMAGNGSVKLNDLTVIYGKNNTGKTYLAYAIYAILENIREYFDIGLSDRQIQMSINDLKENGRAEIDMTVHFSNFRQHIAVVEKKIVNKFHTFFSLGNEYFSDLKISLDFGNVDVNLDKFNSIQFTPEFWGEFQNKSNRKMLILTFNKNSLDSDILDREYTVDFLRFLIHFVIFNNILGKFCPFPFPVCSDRTGISLFHMIFDYKNSKLTKFIATTNDLIDLNYIKELIPTYALPIEKNIDIVRNYGEYLKNKSFIFNDSENLNIILSSLSELVEGTFSSNNGVIYYHPNELIDQKINKIPLSAASSSVKALFSLDIFVKHVANTDHILIIDEPELNLHPEKQVIMAQFIASLVKVGVKVLITTHSDFIMREINNLVMLNSLDEKYEESIMNEHGFSENFVLDHKRISAYSTTKDFIIEEVKVDRFGIDSKVFDDVFTVENRKRQDIFSCMEKK